MEPKQAKLRAKQIWHWIYNRGATDFAQMTDIAKAQHPWLAERFVDRPARGGRGAGVDRRHAQMAAALARRRRITRWCSSPTPIAARLCVSSQVGCTLNCRFCHTGTMRLVRNLTAGEIVGQVMLARDALGEWPSQPEGRMLTNIVMMGMGEPLYNFDAVRDALQAGDGRRRAGAQSSGGSRCRPRAWCR